MTDTLQPSPMLEAVDLIRVNLNALSDEELDEHAAHVVNVLLGLEGVLAHAIWVSSIAAANVATLSRKLRAHLARVKELLETRQVEAAEGEDEDEPPAASHCGKRATSIPRRRGGR